MSTSINDVIANGLAANGSFVHRYVDDLKPEEFHHQPMPGVNSAAWVLGHLILTERRTLGAFEGVKLPPLPDGFEANFAQTGKPAGDQHALGDGPELVALFDATRATLVDAVRAAPPEKLAGAPPRNSPFFSTLGEMAAFMGQHTALHVGQVTLIRRSLGYPPVA